MFDRVQHSFKSKLPESFWFGVATADHQCEAYVAEYADIQDLWEETRNLTRRQRATDFWHRYGEDIRLTQGMGCKVFRLSLAWARLEPRPGEYNDEAFAHYRQVLETIRAEGMEPLVTLHHYTWPIHVEQRGGSIAGDFPEIFATYANEVATRLGDLVTYWVTFNEPNQLIFGYFKAGDYHMPPGNPPGTSVKEQMGKIRRLIPNLFEAHSRARSAIKAHHPEAKVGANPFLFGLPPLSRWFVDWQVTRLREEDWERQGYRYEDQSFPWPRDVDMVAAMLTVTQERGEQVDFSEVYFVDGLRVLVKQDSELTERSQLAGGAIAVVEKSTAAAAIFSLFPESTNRQVPTLADALQALDRGEVAAVLADEVLLRGAISQSKSPENYRFVGEKLSSEPYAVGVPEGSPFLLEAIDYGVQLFRDTSELNQSCQTHLPHLEGIPGELSQVTRRKVLLLDRELESEATLPLSIPLPQAEPGTRLRKIQDRGYLLAGIRSDVPGMGYYNRETGDYEGLEVDLAHKIAEVIFGDRQKVQFRAMGTQKRLPMLCSPFPWLDRLLQSFSVLSTIFNSNWWNLGMAGKLPEFLCPKGCAHQQDFVGFDYYWGTNVLWPRRILQLSKAAQGLYTKAPVWPGGLYRLLKQHAQWFPGQDIIIVENGCVVEADGVTRLEYIRQHVDQIRRAYAEGVTVKAYLCWAITSNREWGDPFGPNSDFGLYHIDLDSDPHLTRSPTEAVASYQALIQDSKV